MKGCAERVNDAPQTSVCEVWSDITSSKVKQRNSRVPAVLHSVLFPKVHDGYNYSGFRLA